MQSPWKRTLMLRAQRCLPFPLPETLFCFNAEKHKQFGHADARFRYPIGFSKALRAGVFERDEHTCQLCGAQPSELDAHHINYDKYDNLPANFVTLCHSCHSMTNHKRGAWIKFFTEELPAMGVLKKHLLWMHMNSIKKGTLESFVQLAIEWEIL